MKKQKNKKKKLAMGGPNAEYEQSQAQANMAIGVVGKINPLIGMALKGGQAIGKMTMDENGMYKSKAGQFIDNSVNPTTGIQNLKDVAKDPSLANIGNQLSLGLIGKGATQQKRANALKTQQLAQQAEWVRNAPGINTMPTFAHGGKLDASDVVQGGQLQSISPDAVQVKANTPSQTDSVELEQAFVDHNEVIDNKNRVFSDSLKTAGGRTIAREAARLEKMKSKSGRFETANLHIDQKLDNLFAYQENMKKKPRKVVGGPLTEDPTKIVDPIELINKKGPDYTPQDPNASPATNHAAAVANLHKALRFKNSLTGVNKDLVPSTNRGETTRLGTMGPNVYTPIDPSAKIAADSVLGTKDYVLKSNPNLFKKPGLVNGGPFDTYLPPNKDWDFLQNSVPNLKDKVQGGFPTGGKFTFQPDKVPFNPKNPVDPFKYQSFIEKPMNTAPVPSFGESDLVQGSTKVNLTGSVQPKNTDWNYNAMKAETVPAAKQGFNWSGVAAGAGQFASDAMNAYLNSRQAKPKAPKKEAAVFVPRVHADAQLAENARQATNTNTQIRRTTAQAGQALSNMGTVLSKRLSADNQVRNAVSNQNAEIAAREAFINSQIGARNNAYENKYREDQVTAKNQQLSNYSQIASNVGEKAMQMRQEKQKEKFDDKYINVLRQKYKDSGLDERFIDFIMDKDQARKEGKKFGGKLSAYMKGGKMKKC